LEVVKLPDSVSPGLASLPRPSVGKGFAPAVIEGSLGKVRPVAPTAPEDTASVVAIPVMGRIAAGTPISAIQNHTHSIPIPVDL
ncbi:hypothetical protein J8J22_22440, partial [Mycobacterium tuberculosis]|nr:hypothetical protein [Mycobacterium tuberculosis]